MRRTLTVLAIALMTCSTASGAVPAKLTADEIFARTRTVFLRNTLPHFVLYTITISFIRGDHRKWQRYDGYEDTRKSQTTISDVSREEYEHPYEPPGGFSFGIPLIKMPRSKAFLVANPLGAPNLAIDYDFGLQPPRPTHSALSAPDPPGTPQIQVIGRIETVARDYRATLAGAETEDGVLVDHLTLVPTHDPERLRLRDIWLDAATFTPLHLQLSANFDRAPSNHVPWMVWLRKVDGGIIIDHEEAQAPLDYGFDGNLGHATVAFTDVTFKDKLGPYDSLGRSGGKVYELWEP